MEFVLREPEDEHAQYNQRPMWRYNAYFGIHTVHHLDLVSAEGPKALPIAGSSKNFLEPSWLRSSASISARNSASAPQAWSR